MTMQTHALGLAGPLVIEPRIFHDDRGFFLESFRESDYRAAGLPSFVQDNHSRSRQGTLRGLHFQSSPGQAKLVRAARGRIYDVIVDMRPGSATFGRWEGVELDDVAHRQLFVPVGFAHGFCVLSESADIVYKVSSTYDPTTECGFRWDDPDVAIRWPVADPILSRRDQESRTFADLCQGLAA